MTKPGSQTWSRRVSICMPISPMVRPQSEENNGIPLSGDTTSSAGTIISGRNEASPKAVTMSRTVTSSWSVRSSS